MEVFTPIPLIFGCVLVNVVTDGGLNLVSRQRSCQSPLLTPCGLETPWTLRRGLALSLREGL